MSPWHRRWVRAAQGLPVPGSNSTKTSVSGTLRAKFRVGILNGLAPRIARMPRAPLAQADYEEIYSRVPRLTVEVIVPSTDGVLLTLRQEGPCQGLWHIPGGTVRFGEPLTDAVQRVAEDELGLEVVVDNLLGYIEYPSHLERGLDWPVGIAFGVQWPLSSAGRFRPKPDVVRWHARLPNDMHDEQKRFLRAYGLAT